MRFVEAFIVHEGRSDTDPETNEMRSDLRNLLGFGFDKLLNNQNFDAKVSQTLLEKFFKIAEDGGNFPVLIIDEAKEVLGNKIHDSETRNLLTYLVSCTKQKLRANVILVSSEHAYPYRLEREGFHLENAGNMIFAGEIPPRDMWNLLVCATYDEGGNHGNAKVMVGMGRHLAELCLAAYGGHLRVVVLAVQGLAVSRDRVKASSYLPNLIPKIVECLETNSETRPLLKAMAKYGFAPVMTPMNPAAELISEKHVGGVVMDSGECVGIATAQWAATKLHFALVPSSQCVRLRIARVLLLIPP